MPSLTHKTIKGHSYYYVRHCQRVDGKPKIVKTTYLGSLDNILLFCIAEITEVGGASLLG